MHDHRVMKKFFGCDETLRHWFHHELGNEPNSMVILALNKRHKQGFEVGESFCRLL
jgi:hypothetical protein